MKKSAAIMLTFALVFVGLTIMMIVLTTIFLYGALTALHDANNVGKVIAGIFLFLATLGYAAVTILCAAGTIPFNVILAHKLGKWHWFNILILVFAIVTIAASIICVFMVPAIESTMPNHSSSYM